MKIFESLFEKNTRGICAILPTAIRVPFAFFHFENWHCQKWAHASMQMKCDFEVHLERANFSMKLWQ